MASTTDRRILAINNAIRNSAYDEEIDEQKYEPFLDGKYKTFAEAFEGGYNRQRGRIIFGILLIIILGIVYLKLKKKK